LFFIVCHFFASVVLFSVLLFSACVSNVCEHVCDVCDASKDMIRLRPHLRPLLPRVCRLLLRQRRRPTLFR
jgi:hypothetical protein